MAFIGLDGADDVPVEESFPLRDDIFPPETFDMPLFTAFLTELTVVFP
jgi:hypothetical protein